jgi:hypothetical protein
MALRFDLKKANSWTGIEVMNRKFAIENKQLDSNLQLFMSQYDEQ